MSHADTHRDANAVVRAEMPHARVEMNLTPLIDVIDAAKGAGVEKVGIVTEGMRKAGGAGTN